MKCTSLAPLLVVLFPLLSSCNKEYDGPVNVEIQNTSLHQTLIMQMTNAECIALGPMRTYLYEDIDQRDLVELAVYSNYDFECPPYMTWPAPGTSYVPDDIVVPFSFNAIADEHRPKRDGPPTFHLRLVEIDGITGSEGPRGDDLFIDRIQLENLGHD